MRIDELSESDLVLLGREAEAQEGGAGWGWQRLWLADRSQATNRLGIELGQLGIGLLQPFEELPVGRLCLSAVVVEKLRQQPPVRLLRGALGWIVGDAIEK